GGENRAFPPTRALTPDPSPVRPPTHPSRTGEGRRRPNPNSSNKKAEGSCFREVAPSPARGGGRWHARGRVGEGAGGGKALLPPPAPPPARPGGGKPLPYFGFAPIYVPRGRGVGGEGGWAAGTSWRFVTACGDVRSFRRPPRPPMPRSLLSVAP